MNKQNMLTVGYMYNCEIQFSVNAVLPYDENRSFLSKSCYFGHKPLKSSFMPPAPTTYLQLRIRKIMFPPPLIIKIALS